MIQGLVRIAVIHIAVQAVGGEVGPDDVAAIYAIRKCTFGGRRVLQLLEGVPVVQEPE